MKGHMQDGKFHPHTEYKKGTRKSRDQTEKTQGIKFKERKARDFKKLSKGLSVDDKRKLKEILDREVRNHVKFNKDIVKKHSVPEKKVRWVLENEIDVQASLKRGLWTNRF